MRFLSRLFWIPLLLMILALVVLFVIANPQPITISLKPVLEPLVLPLWAGILATFGIGLLIGGFLVWIASLSIRAKLRMAQRKIQKIDAALAVLEQKQQSERPAEITKHG